MMRLFDSPFLGLLRKQMRKNWGQLFWLALVSGASDTLLLVLINRSIGDAMTGALSAVELLLFGSLLSIHSLIRYRMLRLAGVAMKNIVYGFRTRIFERLLRLELPEYEKLGRTDLQLTLGRDLANLSAPSTPFFDILSTIFSTFFCFMYLFELSPLTALIVVSLNVGYGVYFWDGRLQVIEHMKDSNLAEGRVFTKVTNLFLGFKELKMHRARRTALMQEHLIPISQEVREVQRRISRQMSENITGGNFFYYMAIATTLFILPPAQVLLGKAAAQTITVMILLFGNMTEILRTLSMLLQYDVSVRNLQTLEKRLERPPLEENTPENQRLKEQTPFECLQLRAASFSYGDSQGRSVFTVGPIELEIRRGELLFLVGGNGSGKSTLLRMLTGLYLPDKGTLMLNDVPISPLNVDTYRQYFSTVFTDFHLFDRLYGQPDVTEAEVEVLLKRFGLDEKIVYQAQQFSTRDLSTGQRKRLALLTALLEKRPILVLDEVGADQDPEFRRFYYEELLPELIAAGKTIMVVSHDERHFGVAERILYMDYGNIDPRRTWRAADTSAAG